MAAPIQRHVCHRIFSILISRHYVLAKNNKISRYISLNVPHQNKKTDVPKEDIGKVFTKPEVQNILKQITGFDLERIFKPRLTEAGAPKYKLVTEKQFKQMQDDAIERGKEKLQMPPVMEPWKNQPVTLSEDPEIEGFDTDTSKYMFTDISFNIPHLERIVTVREPNGTLRTSNSIEHDRLIHTYFPRSGRMHHLPGMFSDENIQNLLEQQSYEYILDRCCVQFEPDDPMYISVTSRTYEHLDSHNMHHVLHCTRHFGVMAFHLIRYKKIDNLLVYMINNERLEDAASTIQLYHLLHPDCESAKHTSQDPQQTIQNFVKTDAVHGGKIELALQVLNEKKTTEITQTLRELFAKYGLLRCSIISDFQAVFKQTRS